MVEGTRVDITKPYLGTDRAPASEECKQAATFRALTAAVCETPLASPPTLISQKGKPPAEMQCKMLIGPCRKRGRNFGPDESHISELYDGTSALSSDVSIIFSS